MAYKEAVRDFSGKIIAWYEYQSNGDIIVREFTGAILGRYDSAQDVTRNFIGTIVARGNAIGMLINR